MGLVVLQQKEKRYLTVCAHTLSESHMAQRKVGCPQARHRALTRNKTRRAP